MNAAMEQMRDRSAAQVQKRGDEIKAALERVGRQANCLGETVMHLGERLNCVCRHPTPSPERDHRNDQNGESKSDLRSALDDLESQLLRIDANVRDILDRCEL